MQKLLSVLSFACASLLLSVCAIAAPVVPWAWVTGAPDLVAIENLSGTNTIYYRSASNTWTAVTIGSGLTFSGGSLATSGGGGGGSGTVTSFSAGALSPLFTSGVANATTTPALSFSLSVQNPNTVFSGPSSGSAATPTFRSLVSADIPDLSATYSAAAHTHTFASLTSKPTTLAGFGITDGQPLDSDLTSIAALTTTSFGRGLLAETNAASLKTTLSLGSVENTAVSTWAGSTNITTVGTIGTGTWNATAIADAKIASALTGKTYNALSLTANATGWTIAGGTSTSKALTLLNSFSVAGIDGATYTMPGATDSILGVLNIDTSAELAAILTDEAGSGGGFVRATSPTIVNPVLTAPIETVIDLGNMGAATAINVSSAGVQIGLLSSASCAVSFTNWSTTGTHSQVFVGFTQAAGGGDVITLPAAVTNNTAVAALVSTTANAVTWIMFWTENAGTTIFASQISFQTVSAMLDSISSTQGNRLKRGATWVGVADTVRLKTEDAMPDGTNAPIPSVVYGTNFPVSGLAYNDTTDQWAYWKIPTEGYTSGNLTLTLQWYADTGSSGTCVWQAKIAAITPDTDTTDIETKAFATLNFVSDTHLGTTAQRLHVCTITISNLDSLAAGDFAVLGIARDADGTNSADSMTGNAILMDPILTIP